jgi:hypothetical protein
MLNLESRGEEMAKILLYALGIGAALCVFVFMLWLTSLADKKEEKK